MQTPRTYLNTSLQHAEELHLVLRDQLRERYKDTDLKGHLAMVPLTIPAT